MLDALRMVIAGLGAGTAYALLALGTVIVYRGSGVVSFATGGFALVGGVTYYELTANHGAPTAVGVVAAVFVAALAAVLVELLIMRPLRRSAPLTRVVATLGVLAVLQQLAVALEDTTRFVPSFLPAGSWSIGQLDVSQDRVILLGITVILAVVLQVLYRRTRFGLATTGVAENERATAALGWSPDSVAAWNWALGGALAGLAGVLVTAVVNNGVSPTSLTLSVVPALGAAVVGAFSSFSLTVAGGLLIGILESLAYRYIPQPGWPSAIPLIVIVVMLVLRGHPIPLRGETGQQLPAVPEGRIRVVAAAIVACGVAVFIVSAASGWASALVTTLVFAALCLSMVVVLGFAGQLSLAQFALTGVGALFATRLSAEVGLPFIVVLVLAPLLTALIGLLVALPAVRVRGVSLAILTLGLAVALSGVVLANDKFTKQPIPKGGFVALDYRIPPPNVAGVAVDEISHPERYALVCLVLVVLLAWIVANIRRGGTGRRMLAVRANERAAMSLGVSVTAQKLFAFALAAALAGVAGVMITYRDVTVQFAFFDPFASIELVLLSVLGGIGAVSGALVGAAIAPAGVIEYLVENFVSLSGIFGLVIAVIVVINLVIAPDGIALQAMKHLRSGRRRAAASRIDVTVEQEAAAYRAHPRALQLSGVGISFGGTRALAGVDLEVAPGEIVGLIGPNGAGKSTVIDVASGFHRKYTGTVRVGGVPVDRLDPVRRARSGLTRSFQSLELFEDLSVEDNIRVACEPTGLRSSLLELVRPRRGTLSAAAVLAIKEFELEPHLQAMPDELSQAQRRVVAIARAVATAPSLLMLDEPAAGLDEASRDELSHLIARLGREWGIGVLLVEHDVDLVMRTCDRVVGLNFGEVIASGTPSEVREDEALVAAYLGDTVEERPHDAQEGHVETATTRMTANGGPR